MTTLNTELYDALIAIKVPEQQARAAATAATGYDRRAGETDKRIGEIEKRLNEIDTRLAVISAELTFHRWVFLAMTGMQVAILIKLFLK